MATDVTSLLVLGALLLYGLGGIILSGLSLLSIMSIFRKSFSITKLLKRSITTFFSKPDFALILIIVVLIHTAGNTLMSTGRFVGDLGDSSDDAQLDENQQTLVVIGVLMVVAGLAVTIAITYPLLSLATGFILLSYKDYQSVGKMQPRTWARLLSMKGLYLLIASALVSALVLCGFALFLFPGLILAWALLYVPYRVILFDENPIAAIAGSWKMFSEKPWDAIFLTSFTAASNVLLASSGLESVLHFLCVYPISTFTVADYVWGARP